MNCIFLSPHFPPHFYLFCRALKKLGANVLGIADTSFDELSEDVKANLTEYFRVESMEDYDQLLRALGYFTHKYGRIDRIDSHNEYWLEKEAQLRTDFNVPGIKMDTVQNIKLKSRMKEFFIKAGVAVARGTVVNTLEEAQIFIKTSGYPIVLKPDNGVGAAHTHKIGNKEDLEWFFSTRPPLTYFAEEFISGDICTFDGLADRSGKPAFYTSHIYSKGVMELASDGDHVYYYSLKDIPPDIIEAGSRTLEAFNVKERFFHIEFFRTSGGKLVGLEVNMRPPGGYTTDMFNYACNIDIYQEWANVLVLNEFKASYTREYYCCFIGRKAQKNYFNSHEAIMQRWGDAVAKQGEMPALFAGLMGDHYYIIRATEMDRMKEIIDFALRLA
jgi:hypothetical protein